MPGISDTDAFKIRLTQRVRDILTAHGFIFNGPLIQSLDKFKRLLRETRSTLDELTLIQKLLESGLVEQKLIAEQIVRELGPDFKLNNRRQ